MQSTGVYWIPLFQILEERGFKVYLVNAHYLKSVPGRKSDVSDCQWIQYLHSVGLLRARFRPPEAICAIRTLWRHRGSLLEMAAEHILHMQKAFSQMNLQLHHVLSDITGTSGQAILDAILSGKRDPVALAQLCHSRVKSPRQGSAGPGWRLSAGGKRGHFSRAFISSHYKTPGSKAAQGLLTSVFSSASYSSAR
jgi:transposase